MGEVEAAQGSGARWATVGNVARDATWVGDLWRRAVGWATWRCDVGQLGVVVASGWAGGEQGKPPLFSDRHWPSPARLRPRRGHWSRVIPDPPPAPGYNHPEATGLLVRGIRSATIIAAVMARCATRVREPRDEGMQCEGVV